MLSQVAATCTEMGFLGLGAWPASLHRVLKLLNFYCAKSQACASPLPGGCFMIDLLLCSRRLFRFLAMTETMARPGSTNPCETCLLQTQAPPPPGAARAGLPSQRTSTIYNSMIAATPAKTPPFHPFPLGLRAYCSLIKPWQIRGVYVDKQPMKEYV